MYSTANTSRSPWRVAFSRPDCGENPMVVSTDRPPSIAHIDELPPRWQLTSFTRRPNIAATRSPMYRCEAPWNPYFATPSSSNAPGTPYSRACSGMVVWNSGSKAATIGTPRSEEHTSELQSPCNLVCRLLLEKNITPPRLRHQRRHRHRQRQAAAARDED